MTELARRPWVPASCEDYIQEVAGAGATTEAQAVEQAESIPGLFARVPVYGKDPEAIAADTMGFRHRFLSLRSTC